jgi:hypothetical protein
MSKKANQEQACAAYRGHGPIRSEKPRHDVRGFRVFHGFLKPIFARVVHLVARRKLRSAPREVEASELFI